MKSQYSRGLTSSSSANFVNPVYQNLFGEGEDNGSVKNETIAIEEHENQSHHPNEENENSFLLIPSTSSYDEDNEEENCDTEESRCVPNNFLTEKHRGNINL